MDQSPCQELSKHSALHSPIITVLQVGKLLWEEVKGLTKLAELQGAPRGQDSNLGPQSRITPHTVYCFVPCLPSLAPCRAVLHIVRSTRSCWAFGLPKGAQALQRGAQGRSLGQRRTARGRAEGVAWSHRLYRFLRGPFARFKARKEPPCGEGARLSSLLRVPGGSLVPAAAGGTICAAQVCPAPGPT